MAFYNDSKVVQGTPGSNKEIRDALSPTSRQFLVVVELIDYILIQEVTGQTEEYCWRDRQYKPVTGLDLVRLSHLRKWYKNGIATRREIQHGHAYSVESPRELRIAKGLILAFRTDVRLAYEALT